MSDPLDNLIAALREELQEYGELLALLDQQQEAVVSRAADQVVSSVAAINEQAHNIEMARESREETRKELARGLGQPEKGSFTEILPLLPESYRPLVKALVDENNALLLRVQRRARQNHLLLSRSLELMPQFLNSVVAFGSPSTYNGKGNIVSPKPGVRPLCDCAL